MSQWSGQGRSSGLNSKRLDRIKFADVIFALAGSDVQENRVQLGLSGARWSKGWVEAGRRISLR